ncbi:MAG: hypothetical protein V1903_02855 [Bacteroidota bacterium]
MAMPLNAVSQTDTTGTAHSLYTSLGYGSNMIYLGSTMSQNQSCGYGSLVYGYKNSLFVSFSGVHLSTVDPYLSFWIGSMSYSHTFNSWFDISAGLYRYQFAKSLTDTLFSNFFYGDLTLGFDWKILYSKVSAGTIFSQGSQGYVQVRNSRYFQTPSFSSKKAYFVFDPYVNILFGSLTRIESSTDTIITVSSPFLKNVSGSVSGTGYGSGNGQGNGNGAGAGTGSGTSSTTGSTTTSSQAVTSTAYTSDFGLMEIDFGLPVSFNTNRLTLEAEAGYILPVFDDPVYQSMKGFVFTFSIFYKIF